MPGHSPLVLVSRGCATGVPLARIAGVRVAPTRAFRGGLPVTLVHGRRVLVALALVAIGGLGPGLVGSARANVLRVCADPDNLPFTSSDPREKGLYLELAELIADRMGTTAEPVFFRTDAGRRSLRDTLLGGRCDAFFGLPYAPDSSAGRTIALTRPFIDVGYALVAPRTWSFNRLDDLDGKTVGVQYASTPQTILSVRDRVQLATFRTAEEAIEALARREIETAFVWGPIAGYRAARLGLLDAVRVISVTGLDLRWRAAIGVRAADQALRERLDQELAALEPAIAKLAEKYHLPLDQPIDLGATAAGTGAGPARKADIAAEHAEAPAPPASPPDKVNPYRGDAAAVVAGRIRFNVHCSHCHSPNAANPEPRTDLRRLHLRYGERVNDVFYTAVTRGRPPKGMPPWGEVLDEETIWKIKTFLESVQRAAE